jgi:hypothetical protein
MATEEKSRDAFDPRKRYAAIGMQQGRVLVDDDVNEGERIRLEDDRRVNLDVIGPVGSPDSGFRIAPQSVPLGLLEFTIDAGTLYLGGLRLWNPTAVKFSAQPDWLEQTAADRQTPNDGRVDLVYLEAWQQPVTAIEDAELFEPALGGPDSSTRLRTMWRVRVRPEVAGDDCPETFQTLIAQWTAQNLGVVDSTHERVVDATLKVEYKPGQKGDLCSPAIASGYLGAENQTIRVQLVDATHLTWGFDNAAPVYRADVADTTTIKLQTDPRDEAHWPMVGQVIEVLPWSAVLPNGEKLAAVGGHFAKVTGYSPGNREIKIAPALPAGFNTAWTSRPDAAQLGTAYAFVRIWNRGDDLSSPPDILFTPGNPVDLGSTGIKVTITGNQRVAGDHWVIAARPDTPDQVIPWSLEVGRGVHGFRRWFAPLALIRWSVTGQTATLQVLHDCRPFFPPLTRLRGCCTHTVGDDISSFGQFKSIQEAVNALPLDGGKVCILPGKYTESVTLIGRQNVTIEGCGKRSIVKPGKFPWAFAVVRGKDVAIRSLAIEAPTGYGVLAIGKIANDTPTTTGAVLGVDEAGLTGLTLDELAITCADLSAIAVLGARWVTITECDIVGLPRDKPLGNDIFGRFPAIVSFADDVLIERNRITALTESPQLDGAVTIAGLATFTRRAPGGIQLGGGSERVEIRRNVITGGNGDGITLGSWAWVPGDVPQDDWAKLAGAWKWLVGGFTLVINEDGCIEVDWDPTPPEGPNGPMVPVSMGDLYDIRILDNTITGMGRSGIGVARFFSLASKQLIVVHRLNVEENRIHGCQQLGMPELPASLRDVAAYAAITLAAVVQGVFRDNDIAENGRRHIDPVCGIYAMASIGFIAEGNRIVENAPAVAGTDETPRPGWRGGIVLPRALPPSIRKFALGPAREDGQPSARITDNVIVVPEGRAVIVVGQGPMVVHANHLTVRGVGRADTGILFSQNINFNVLLTIALFEQVISVAGVPAWLDLAGGVGVAIVNSAVSADVKAPQQLMYSNGIGSKLVGASAKQSLLSRSGQVLFTDNQVGIDLRAEPRNLILSGVLVLSADDVALEDNQITLDRARDFVQVTAIVFAITVRVVGNRIRDSLAFGSIDVLFDLLGLSALTYGMFMNTTAHNQTTRCMTIGGLAKVDTPNQILFEVLFPSGCSNAKVAENVLIGMVAANTVNIGGVP